MCDRCVARTRRGKAVGWGGGGVHLLAPRCPASRTELRMTGVDGVWECLLRVRGVGCSQGAAVRSDLCSTRQPTITELPTAPACPCPSPPTPTPVILTPALTLPSTVDA